MGFFGVVGHEFVGVVEKVHSAGGERPDDHELTGKRVVGEINLGEGSYPLSLFIYGREYTRIPWVTLGNVLRLCFRVLAPWFAIA